MANDATGTPLALGDTVAIPGRIAELQEVTDENDNNLRVETIYKTPGGGTSHMFAVSSAQVEKISDVPGALMKDTVEPPIVDPDPPESGHPSHPIHRPDRPSGPDKPELPDKPVGPGKPERPDVKPEPVKRR